MASLTRASTACLGALLLISSLLLLPGTASANSIDEACDAGAQAGVGLPLVITGALQTIGGIVLLFTDPEPNYGAQISLGMGITELVIGGTILGIGLSNQPPDNTFEANAYDAGYDIGSGGVQIGFGTLFLLESALLFSSGPDSSSEWSNAVLSLVLGSYLFTSGVFNVDDAKIRLRNIRAQAAYRPALHLTLMQGTF